MRRYEENLIAFVRTKHPQLAHEIATSKELTEETEDALKRVLEDFDADYGTA
jgi:F0F1-type ATP synthase alpha subunit